MTFENYEYKRPNMTEVEASFKEALEKFNNANSASEQIKIYHEINKVRSNYGTMATLCNIRHTVNTKDEFYEAEKQFFNESGPLYASYVNEFLKALNNSKFKDQLIDEFGDHLFNLIEVSLKSFDPVIIPDLQEENRLSTEYSKLIASAQIEFDGKINNLSQMGPYLQSSDRAVRKEAEEAFANFFLENEEKFDEIYDSLVKVRHQMALKLGYENYIEMGYYRLDRTDYNAEDVKTYRDQVYREIVPIHQKIVKLKAERLGIEDLKSYDLSLEFLSGNATPKGSKDELVAVAKNMYEELSPQTDEFFNYMLDHNLMDLEAKPGKASGGYCTFIDDYKSPFIFANFNGTSGDVDVLTHEAGHAFQIYSCRDFEIKEYLWPTLEACEIHSMSMEFLAWPWIDGFFKEDTDKYLYSHLTGAIGFIPYGVAVDEFQHEVYANPSMTPEERKTLWRSIEKKYLPHKVYEVDILERGGFWFRQSHIFSSPFYYIDYTLAQVCAFQYWYRNLVDPKEAWESYLKLCELGGSKSFLDLLEVADLKNPFEEGTIKEVIAPLEKWLDEFDQSKLK